MPQSESFVYVRRWPIADQELSAEQLRAEAIPDLLEALNHHGLFFAPDATTYRVVDGLIPFFEARLVVRPRGDADLSGLTQVASDPEFDVWHADEYFRELKKEAAA